MKTVWSLSCTHIPHCCLGQSHPCSSLVERDHGWGCVADGRTADACCSLTYDTWPLVASRSMTMHCFIVSMAFQAFISAGTGDEVLSPKMTLLCTARLLCTASLRELRPLSSVLLFPSNSPLRIFQMAFSFSFENFTSSNNQPNSMPECS